MALFDAARSSLLRHDPKWAQSKTGKFHRFINIDPEELGLSGASGVYVIWHSGVSPKWVYVGKSKDLAKTFHQLAEDDDIIGYEVNGGLFVSWAMIRDEYQDGVACYLRDALKPIVENPSLSCKGVTYVPVISPGSKPDPE